MARLTRHAKVRRATGRITLVEVLVLFVMTLLVAALVVPMAAGLRKQAMVTKCMSNLGQLVQAHNTHIGSKKRNSAESPQQAAKLWVQILKSQSGLPDKAYYCPVVFETNDGFGSAMQSWSAMMDLPQGYARAASGYGINGWIVQPDRLTLTYSGARLDQFIAPTSSGSDRIPVFADSTWQNAWPRANDPTPPNLRDGDRGHQGSRFAPRENMMGRFTIARHGSAINVAFLDGHVETVSLKNLKRLTWHNGYVATDWQPALPEE